MYKCTASFSTTTTEIISSPLNIFIQNISEIVERKESMHPAEYEKEVRNVLKSIKKDLFDSFLNWKETEAAYTRNHIYSNNHMSMYAICWWPGKMSAIHDHPAGLNSNDGCWMYILQGQLTEYRYKRDKTRNKIALCGTSELLEGSAAFIHDAIEVHSVGNTSVTERAVTIHIYSSPFSQFHVWPTPETPLDACTKVHVAYRA